MEQYRCSKDTEITVKWNTRERKAKKEGNGYVEKKLSY